MRFRPQFTLRTLLIAIMAIACFLGGMALQRRLDEPTLLYKAKGRHLAGWRDAKSYSVECIQLRDGTTWERRVEADWE